MKILYITTVSGTINAFLVPQIKMLIDLGHVVDVACNMSTQLDPRIKEYGCKTYKLDFSRSPIRIGNYRAYKDIKKIVSRESYNIVHTHTPVASAITRLACKGIKNVKVFYTAHGFHFFKGAPYRNWFVYYPLEKWLSKYTDTLITINKEDYKNAKKKLKAKHTKYIHGIGLDIEKFTLKKVDVVKKRQELHLPKDAFVILSVGELNENKNHEVILRAIGQLDNNKIYYLICGKGALEKDLIFLAEKLGIQKNVRLLGFRKDIVELCKSSDAFAFPSKREGLGMAGLEAMACGLPLVTSNIRGVTDYSKNGVTGYTANPDDVSQFATNIDYLFRNTVDRLSMGRNNQKVIDKYSIKNSLDRMYEIYFL